MFAHCAHNNVMELLTSKRKNRPLLSAIFGVAVYLAKGAADPSVILPSCAGVIAGGIVGALLLKKINSRGLSLLFYALMIAAGLKLSL